MGERREGVLVRVLVRVLVLVLVLVELGAQVRWGAQGSPAVSALGRQEPSVQFLSQDVLLWKRRKGEGDSFSPNGVSSRDQDRGRRRWAHGSNGALSRQGTTHQGDDEKAQSQPQPPVLGQPLGA